MNIKQTCNAPINFKRAIQRFISLSILLIAYAQVPALADATITTITDGQQATIKVKGQRILVNIDNTSDSAIFDAQQQTLYLIDHQKKVIRPINDATLQQVEMATSAVNAQLNKLPSAQKQQLAQFLGLSLDEPETDKITLKFISSKQHHGIRCNEQQILRKQQALGAVCMTAGNTTPLNGGDYSTLLAAQSYLLKLSKSAKTFAQYFNQPIPALDGVKVSGLLISGQQTGKDASSFKLNSINLETVNEINLPAGYQTKNISELLQ